MEIREYDQVWKLWEGYQDVLYAYVLKNVKDKETTEDLVHDVLLKIHKSCCSGIEVNNVKSWVLQIAHNTMIDYYKTQKKMNSPLIDLNVEQVDKDIYEELSVFLEPLIGFLPTKYALPLRLADIEGLKHQNIADHLGLSLSATKSRIQRARLLLKNEINTCFHVDDCSGKQLINFRLKESCTPLQLIAKGKKD